MLFVMDKCFDDFATWRLYLGNNPIKTEAKNQPLQITEENTE